MREMYKALSSCITTERCNIMYSMNKRAKKLKQLTHRLDWGVDGGQDEQQDQVDHDPLGEASQVEEEGDEGHDDDHQGLDEGRHDVEPHLEVCDVTGCEITRNRLYSNWEPSPLGGCFGPRWKAIWL